MNLHIVVCVKLVPDHEAPPSAIEINDEEKKVTARGVSPVINSFDESALEAAIRIKEAVGGKITLISAGVNLSKAVVLKAMAPGVDEAILMEDGALENSVMDSWATAQILSQVIQKYAGDFDLILAGRQASDTNAGQVGIGLSGLLDIPAVTLAQKVEAGEGRMMVERVLPDGYEVVEVPTPALVTVSGELGELRFPSIQAIKAAKKLPQQILSLSDLDESVEAESKVEIVKLEAPSRERSCQLVEGASPEEAGRKLAQKLKEDKVV